MPILDGRPVPASAIDPARHRFIGMWRPPELVVLTGNYFRARWAEGLYDEPQYVSIEPLYVQDAGGPQGFGTKFGDTVKIRRPVEQIREKERALRESAGQTSVFGSAISEANLCKGAEPQRRGNQFVPMSEVFPNEPESAEPVDACGNCRFFTDHQEAPGECRAHPEPVEKFSFHWCGEWEPR